MLAKRFFYVSAGILMLAITFHLGAMSARAQVVQTLDGPNIESTASGYTYFTGAIGRTFYYMSNVSYAPSAIADPIPGTSAVIETQSGDSGQYALLANGDVYSRTNGPQWTLRGNLYASLGPTPAKAESFGQLKVKYRP